MIVIIAYALSFVIILFSGFLSSALSLVFLGNISKRLIANRGMSARTILFIQGCVEGGVLACIIFLIFHGLSVPLTLITLAILVVPYIFEQFIRCQLSSFAPYRDIPHAVGRILGIVISIIFVIK